MKRLFTLIIIGCSYTLLSGFCRAEDIAEDIRVQVVGAQSGLALSDLPLWVYPFDKDKPTGKPVELKTTADGWATFHLEAPWPKKLLIVGDVSGKYRACSPSVILTSDVVEKGVVLDPKDHKCHPEDHLERKFHAAPGQAILFVRPLKWWERMQK